MWGYFVVYASIFRLSALCRFFSGAPNRWKIFTIGNKIFAFVCAACDAAFLRWLVGPPSQELTSSDIDVTSNSIRRALRNCGTVLAVVIYVLIAAILTFWPIWWIYPTQAIWQAKVWNGQTCQGWDYEITMNTINYQQLGVENSVGEQILSNATLLNSSGISYFVDLQHPWSNISLITFHGNSERPSLTVEYNFTSFWYASSENLSGPFNKSPVLSFPNLKISSLYPSNDWRRECYPPSTALVDSSNKQILRTEVVNYNDCTMMKVCGMNPLPQLAISLGAILIEMEKGGLCCTNPYGYNLGGINVINLVCALTTAIPQPLPMTLLASISIVISILRTKTFL